MRVIRSNTARVCGDERGYTLPEILTAVSIMSIILAIGIIVLLALLERWRVEAADQFAADLRLAHTSATEQLTDWRVVFMHDGTSLSRCASADYCVVELNVPCGAGDPTPALADDTPQGRRELPERTEIKEVTFDPDCSHDDRDAVVAAS
jgi:prepilin-type N-terminal cleavage/methylation domain-containing protein